MLDTPQIGGTPLTILAGVPDNIVPEIRQRLIDRYRRADGHPLRIFRIITGGKTGGYYSEHVVKRTIVDLREYISGKREKAESQYNPSHISLVYLDINDVENRNLLLRYFFLFSLCFPIPYKNIVWSHFSVTQIADLYINAIDSLPTWKDEMKSSCFCLPIRNFYISKTETLASLCLNRIQETPRLMPVDVSRIRFNICKDKSKCPKCRSEIVKNPKDNRELCFPPGAEHGFPRETETQLSQNHQCFLEALYRFGQPIKLGTQSDVQFKGEKKLGVVTFSCCLNGEMSNARASYANVYTNDFVRFPVK